MLKKPPKEALSSESILKTNWLKKHSDFVPSVVLLITPFCIDWPASEWIRRESSFLDQITKLRNVLTPRDIKVILLSIRTGSGIIDKEVIEERINSMKRHLQLDTRNYLIMNISDLNAQSSLFKKLSKIVRELSSTYYISQGRRLKNIEKMIRPMDVILVARYNFKVAFYYEFQNLFSKALKHYQQCYVALLNLKDSDDDDFFDEIKAVAEMANFKICSILLKTGEVKSAAQHIRGYMDAFRNAVASRLWKHYSWMSDQYVIYAQLLTIYSINQSFTDSDRSFYYHNAAMYTLKRQRSFRSSKTKLMESASVVDIMSSKFFGMKIIPSKYLGRPPDLYDSNLDQVITVSDDLVKLRRLLIVEKEKDTDYPSLILSYLKKALDCLNPLHRRRRSYLRMLIAKQHISTGDYEQAGANLTPAVELFGRERWTTCAIPMLMRKMSCAIYLGKAREYLNAALVLYSLDSNAVLSKHDKEQLHRDVFSLIYNTEKPSVEFIAESRRREPAISSSHIPLTLRPEYGAALAPGFAPEYYLPDGYVIDLGENTTSLINVNVEYSHKIVEVGKTVSTTIILESSFYGSLAFSEMWAHFTEDLIVQHFVHEKASNSVDGEKDLFFTDDETDCEPGSIATNLILHPKRPVKIKFDLFIPESAVGNVSDSSLSLEKVVFSCHLPHPLSTSVSEDVDKVDDVANESPYHLDDTTASFNSGVKVVNQESPEENNLDSVIDEAVSLDDTPMESTEEIKLGVETTIDGSQEEFSAVPVTDSVAYEASDVQNFEMGGKSVTIDSDNECESDDDQRSNTIESEREKEHIAIVEHILPSEITDMLSTANGFDDSEAAHLGEGSSAIANASPSLQVAGHASATSASPARRPSVFIRRKKYREIIFEASALTRIYREARVGVGRTIPITDLSKFMGSEGPKVLSITKPKPMIKLLEPKAQLTILQGTIQRVDFVFSSDMDSIIDGKVFVSSDYSPPTGNYDLFWYPEVSNSDTSAEMIYSSKFIDSVKFHPLTLSGSFQPAVPFKLECMKPFETFCCPIFVKSDIQGTIMIRLKIEYLSSDTLKTSIVADFAIAMSVVKPYGMNFNITSLNDPHCGVEKKQSVSTVLRGDVVSMQASLDCVNSLGKNLQILDMYISPSSCRGLVSQVQFELVKTEGGGDLLYTGRTYLTPKNVAETNLQSYINSDDENSKCITLRKGEAYVGSVDMLCIRKEVIPVSFPMGGPNRFLEVNSDDSADASMGDVMLHWRIDDKTLLNSPVKQMQQASQVLGKQNKPFEWLLPFANVSAQEVSPINYSVTRTRICSMMFTVPPVKVWYLLHSMTLFCDLPFKYICAGHRRPFLCQY